MTELRVDSAGPGDAVTAASKKWATSIVESAGGAAVLAAGLLVPLIVVMVQGWTLVGVFEESAGYRYFYSLRAFYGGEYVFLPQGQLCDVIYQALHALLSAIGMPMDTLLPRIDWFCYSAVALAHLVTLAAFVWVAGRLPIAEGILLALFWLLAYFAAGDLRLLQPDYHPWVPAAALSAVALCERYRHRFRRTWRDALLIGGVCGCVASVKTTLIVLPLTVLFLVAFIGERPSPAWFMVATGTGAVTWSTILLVLYHGRVYYVLRWLSDFLQFADSARSASDYGDWVTKTAIAHPSVPWITIVLPILLATAAVCLRRGDAGRVALALLPAAVAYHWIVYRRDTPTTWFEAFVFVQFAVTTLFFTLARLRAHPWFVGLSALLCLAVIGTRIPFMADYVASIGRNHLANEALARAKSMRTGALAVLFPDNPHRLLSFDSALFKGGSDIFVGRFGASPLVSMFARGVSFFAGMAEEYRRRPLDLTGFSTVLFVIPRPSLPTDPQNRMRQLEMHYHTSLALFACGAPVDFIDRDVYLCDRREAFWPTVTGLRPLFVPLAANLTPGSAVIDAAGLEKRLAESAVVMSGESGQLLTLTGAGATRISTVQGARVHIANAGAWDPLRRAFVGLGATFLNGQWRFDPVVPPAVNPNPSLKHADVRGAVEGFSVYGVKDDAVRRHADQDGAYVRLVVRRSRQEIGLRAVVRSDGIHDPLSVRARVRAPAGMIVRLRVHDTLEANEPGLAHYVDTTSTGTTQTVVMSGLRLYGVSAGDSIAVALMHAHRGNWLEVRELGLYMGALPNQ